MSVARTTNEVSRSIGRRIRALRKENGISQDKLAEAIGVSKWSVSAWERGTGIPESSTLETLADYFKTTIAFLVGSSDEREAPTIEQDIIKGQLSVFEEADAIGECARMLARLDDPIDKAMFSAIRAVYAQAEAAGKIKEPDCIIEVTAIVDKAEQVEK